MTDVMNSLYLLYFNSKKDNVDEVLETKGH